jgi:hypothetical protein
MGYPFVGDDAALVAMLRLLATGQPDHAGQGFTTLEQGGKTLDALGIAWHWTSTLAAARDDPDHFILWLPNGLFNDPLSYWNGGRDTSYTATSVAAAFGGAYILDGPPRAATQGTTAGRSATVTAGQLVVSCPEGVHLRETPALAAPVLATLDDGEAVRDAYTGECLWTFVAARGLRGWVRREYVKSRQQAAGSRQ